MKFCHRCNNKVEEWEDNCSICKKEEKESTEFYKKDTNKIKDYLKQINWDEISDNWEIHVYIGTRYEKITLNPYQDCSESNPLYKHKKWLKRVYTKLNLTDQIIAEIFGFIGNKTIGNWRKKFNIPTKIVGHYFKKGYKFLNMPKKYKHPKLNPMGDKKVYRAEHIVIMEDYLNKTLTSEELSLHPCLIKNDNKYYIKKDCDVHHKNHIRWTIESKICGYTEIKMNTVTQKLIYVLVV